MSQVHSLPRKWQPIAAAPPDANLEVCVIDQSEVHALVFPCRRNGTGWADAVTRAPLDIRPTHWRLWNENGRTDG